MTALVCVRITINITYSNHYDYFRYNGVHDEWSQLYELYVHIHQYNSLLSSEKVNYQWYEAK